MPSNPYATKYQKRKPPPKTSSVSGELGVFTYHCAHCLKEHKHSTGYMWVAFVGPDRFYFCSVNCYEDWLKNNPEVKDQRGQAEPVPDRRGAVAHTKAKEKE
jgi:hypothetical protein